MKNILGSFLFIFTLLANEYDIAINKNRPFQKEPVVITLSFYPKNIKEIDWVEFEPVKKREYEFYTLKKESIKNGFRFEYLLFPLKSGEIKIDYNLTYKRAPFKEIQNKILGTGYEQTKPIEGEIFNIKTNSSKIYVKEAQAKLYGDFSLNVKADKKRVSAYEPVYLTITLKGVGYKPQIKNLLKKPNILKVLEDKPKKSIKYTKKGAKINYTFNYALISDKNFTIKPIELKEFNYKEYRVLKTPKINIEVLKPKLDIDKKDSPMPIKPISNTIFGFFGYVVVFIAGGVSGILILMLFGRRLKDVKDILLSDKKELLAILCLRFPEKFSKEKEILNKALLEKKRVNLLKMKFSILKEIL
jgi:hypothetical protein